MMQSTEFIDSVSPPTLEEQSQGWNPHALSTTWQRICYYIAYSVGENESDNKLR